MGTHAHRFYVFSYKCVKSQIHQKRQLSVSYSCYPCSLARFGASICCNMSLVGCIDSDTVHIESSRIVSNHGAATECHGLRTQDVGSTPNIPTKIFPTKIASFPGNSLQAWEFHPLTLRFCLSQTL